MRTPKFNFIPENQLNSATPLEYKVTITKKHALYFSKEVLDIYELTGKYIRLFVDIEKKVLGWKVVTEEKSLGDLKGMRKLTPNKIQGSSMISIASLLKTVAPDISLPKKNIDVRKYTSPLLEEAIYYIELV